MLRKLGFMTRCVLQDCIIAAVFHHRLAVIRNTTFPYNGLAARRALYEFAANDLPSSFKNAGVCEILTMEQCFGLAYGFMFESRFPTPLEAIGVAMQFVGVCSAIAVFSTPRMPSDLSRNSVPQV